jgi:hypothetical protein
VLLAALLDDELERRLVASGVLELVDPVLGDRDHPRVEVQRRRDGGQARERLEVALHELAAGRVGVGVRRGPARGRQQLLGDRVDVEAPRREDPHVRPLAHARADLLAGLEHERLDPAGAQVRGGREADRPGSDHGDDDWVLGHGDSLPRRTSKKFDA